MISFWLYDPHRNVARPQNVDLDNVQFHSSTEHNFFRVRERMDDSLEARATDGEYLCMNDVTPEQIVILFSTVRGLKEAARE